MLIGNKVDLGLNDIAARKVPHEIALKFAKDHGLLYEETSAVTVVRVREAFENLLQGKI